jgi:hypothetical protein
MLSSNFYTKVPKEQKKKQSGPCTMVEAAHPAGRRARTASAGSRRIVVGVGGALAVPVLTEEGRTTPASRRCGARRGAARSGARRGGQGRPGQQLVEGGQVRSSSRGGQDQSLASGNFIGARPGAGTEEAGRAREAPPVDLLVGLGGSPDWAPVGGPA